MKCPKCGSEMEEEYHLSDYVKKDFSKPFLMCRSCGYWEEKAESKVGEKE